MKKPHKAFSLIELSIVILVISIFIGAAAKTGSIAIKKMRLETAKSATLSSPVTSISDLKLWVETSLDNSTSLSSSETVVDTWYDINPQSKTKHNLVSQSATTSSSTSYESLAINDLPALYFNNENYFSVTKPEMLTNTSYTVFIVEKPSAGVYGSDSPAQLMGNNLANSNINLVYNNHSLSDNYHNKIRAVAFSGLSHVEFTHNFNFNFPNIHSLKFNQTDNNYYYWLNGGSNYEASGTRGTSRTTSCKPCSNTQTIGGYGYRGYISEIIIFGRSLSDTERQDVENYLSKKYSILIS